MGNGYFFHFFDLVHSTLPANISLNFQPILKILAVLKSLAKTLLKSRFSHQSEHFYCLWWTNTKKDPKMVKIPYKFGSFFRIFDLWCGHYSGRLSAKWFQITLILYKCRPKKMLHRNLKVPGTLLYILWIFAPSNNSYLLPYNTVFLLAAVFVFRVFPFSPCITRRQKFYFLLRLSNRKTVFCKVTKSRIK